MNWKRWLGYGIYRKLWSLIGGRPWTFIWRDTYHRAPYVIQCLWFGLGVLSTWLVFYYHLPLWVLGIGWGIYTFGFLEGHFHWGKKYIPDQQGN